MSLSKENKVIIDGQTYYGGLNQPNLKFIKVNVDCWEKIFDFLSLRDILAMSQTCQRMRQIGGHYFCENFHGKVCGLSESSSGLRISIDDNPIDNNDFLRFVDTISIRGKLNDLRSFSRMGLLSSLTTLHFCHVNLNENQLQGFENIQSNIETIKLIGCSIDDASVGVSLASYPKLKCLKLYFNKFKSTAAKASIFQRTYPMLELFKFDGCESDLIPFLERNPNNKGLWVEACDLELIPLGTTTLQLDYLDVDFTGETDDTEHNTLKILHANGFFKKLRLSIDFSYDGFDHELFFREMKSFSAFEALETCCFDGYPIGHLTQLKELILYTLNIDADVEEIGTSLNNVERLCIHGTLDHLLSFLHHSKKLKYVIFHERNYDVDYDDDDEYDDHVYNALNLFDLNRVRIVSGSQRKVQIGLKEKQYLATKWNQKGLNFDLVEITREETLYKHFYYKDK